MAAISTSWLERLRRRGALRSGLDILRELNARQYAAPVYLISARDESPTIVDAFRSGARDFLANPFDPYTAVQRVRDAVELWSSREERRSRAELEAMTVRAGGHLTRREAEVLSQIAHGVSSKDIGTALGIGKRTVDNFRVSILRKLGAENAADLVRIVMS